MEDLINLRVDLLSDFFFFNRFIFKERTGRDFIVSKPVSNISHFIEICDALEDVFYGRVKRLLINCPPGWSKCIDPLTNISTPSGMKYAKDIKIGDQVYTYDKGKLGIESCIALEDAYKQSIKITMRSGREIICSTDHRMLTTFGYVQAKDIKIGDRIKAINSVTNGNLKIDRDILTFITLMIFEGCCIAPSIRFANQDDCIVSLFYQTCSNIGFNAKNYGKRKCDHHILQGTKKKNELFSLLEQYGILNKYSHNKRLPKEWFGMSEIDKLWFIDLMFATDGYIDKGSGTAGIALANKGLIEDIQHLLATLKIPTTFYYKPNKCKGAWCLKISRLETQKLLNKITFFHKRDSANHSLSKVAYSGIDNYPNCILDSLSDRKARRNGCRIDNNKNITPDRFNDLCAIFPELEKFRETDFYYDEVARIEDVGERNLLHLQINRTENFIANGLVSHNSELVKNFICWSYAWYDFCNNIYISYSHELASAHTHVIKQTIMMPIYRKLFNVEINRETSAKDFFKTTGGGAVAAFGSSGAITGRDAGLPGLDTYSGGVFIDDIHKPDEVHSDIIREKVKRNYIETIEPRCRGINVPIVIIGQRLHQDDLFSYLLAGEDGNEWTHVNIQALDPANNARFPEVMPKEKLLNMKKHKPYVFASQYQQNPVPAGGGLYKEDDFPLLEHTPEILATFITADTAETDKEWNDKTVFSFWGLYAIKNKDIIVDDMYALHWLDCVQLSIEPKDLEAEFLDFWASCMTFKVKPQCAIIEKKSTGVTLVSVLKNTQGLKVIGIDRTAKSGSKTQRFIDMQQYIASKQVTLPLLGKHTKMVVDHMTDITANNTHRFDDIADTCYDAVKAAFIDKIIITRVADKIDYDDMAKNMMQGQQHVDYLRMKAYGTSR